jgi:hypothetical protein
MRRLHERARACVELWIPCVPRARARESSCACNLPKYLQLYHYQIGRGIESIEKSSAFDRPSKNGLADMNSVATSSTICIYVRLEGGTDSRL